MRKGANVAGVIGTIIAGIILVLIWPFVWLYEQVGGKLFFAIVIGIPAFIWAYKDWKKEQTKKARAAVAPAELAEERAARKGREAEEFHAQNIRIIQERERQAQRECFLKKHHEKEQRKVASNKEKTRVHTVEAEDGSIAIEWRQQFDEINKAWGKGDYDFARTWLQKLAYSITSMNASQEVHDKLKQLMVAFTRDDPLYADVMRVAIPVIAANPGIVQSALSKQFPQFDVEQFRYAMYYGEIIGDVARVKNGRSYALTIPARTNSPSITKGADMNNMIEVNAEQAAEWLYNLFQQDIWLLEVKPVRHLDTDIEQQAVGFLLSVAEQGVNSWGSASQEVKETVSLLLMDFLAKLMHPQSPFAKQRWEVDAADAPLEKILAIISAEIRRSHPHFVRQH